MPCRQIPRKNQIRQSTEIGKTNTREEDAKRNKPENPPARIDPPSDSVVIARHAAPKGLSPTALDARQTTTTTTTVHSRVSFQSWADMRNRRNPLRVPWRFIQGVFPQFPAHKIPGSSIYNHGYLHFETGQGTGIAFKRPGGSLILIFQSPENGGY